MITWIRIGVGAVRRDGGGGGIWGSGGRVWSGSVWRGGVRGGSITTVAVAKPIIGNLFETVQVCVVTFVI